MAEVHRAVGGKRHGTKFGLPITADEVASGVVRISVTTPSGAQLELGTKPRVVMRPSDRDETGKLRPEAVMRMIAECTGPQVAMMGHVAFALAHLQAARQGRQPDGRFLWTPTEAGDLLGYRRESNGKSGSSRISKEAIATIRRNFATYANTVITQTLKLPDGTTDTINGSLLYPTQKDYTRRKPGQRGRDKRTEWRIRDELWELVKSHYILIPVEFLHRQGEDPRVWAECVRLYEVLAVHARNNTGRAATGPLELSLERLAAEANLTGYTVKAGTGKKRLLDYFAKLKARGALESFSEVTLRDGRAGIAFTLPAERRAELGVVAGRAAMYRELAAGGP
jgi:hypothetical protein